MLSGHMQKVLQKVVHVLPWTEILLFRIGCKEPLSHFQHCICKQTFVILSLIARTVEFQRRSFEQPENEQTIYH